MTKNCDNTKCWQAHWRNWITNTLQIGIENNFLSFKAKQLPTTQQLHFWRPDDMFVYCWCECKNRPATWEGRLTIS